MNTLHSTSPGLLTRFLHWAVAFFMISLTLLGYLMVKFEIWSIYSFHKSMGVMALLIIIPRAIIRFSTGLPVQTRQYFVHEAKFAKLVHWGLLISTLLIPITGILYSGAAGRGVAIFGLEIIPTNLNSNQPDDIIPYSESLRDLSHFVHIYLPMIMLVLLALHIVGALKHIILDRHNPRM